MGKLKHEKGDKIVFIDEVEADSPYTPMLHQVCTLVMEFDIDNRRTKEEDRVIAIVETPNLVYRHNQFISLLEFRKQKIEKCLKKVTK